jgi:hypothetical protein
MLGLLADNGGPTMTMALHPGSPAVDAGVSLPDVTTDQRGISRPQGSAPDIGAFEVQFALVVTAQPPGSITAGSGFGLTVTAEDSSGNVETSYNGTVAVALASNPGGATLGGTLVATAQSGVATFSGLTLAKAGTGYTLRVSASGLTSATTNAFNVWTAGADGGGSTSTKALPPTLVGLQYSVNPVHPSTLVLTFSQPMDVARAEDPANYRLVWAGRDHRLGTKDDRVVRIRSARYDAASQSVTLRLMHRQPLRRTLWLTVGGSSPGGLTNAAGTPLADVGPGRPGSRQAVPLNLKALQRPMRMGLLSDGGFETPRALPPEKGRTLTAGHRALALWRITSGSVNVQGYWPAVEGTHTLDLNGVSAGTIEQTFATIPGQVYQLLFNYANNPDRPAGTATATVTVTGAGTLLSRRIAHTGSTPRDMRYTPFLGNFVADSTSATPRFISTTPGAHGIVLEAVSVIAIPGAADTAPPVIQLTTAPAAGPVSQNMTFAGRVTDDATGVARLEAQVDSGPFQPVALDALGQFTFTTALATDGTADGVHVVQFRARDRAGNVSQVTTESFVLATPSGNLLTNSDFSLGNAGFTSQLDYFPIGGNHNLPGYYYAIVHNPSVDLGSAFGNFGDLTTGTGLMFAADGSAAMVWQEPVNVSNATDYVFSGWAASMGQYPIGTPKDPSPARLAFIINDVQIGWVFAVAAQNGQWSQFSAAWNSGMSGLATIKIVDMNTDGMGNDFTLDDLFFGPRVAIGK